jgi:hypothetical protein
VLNSRKTLHKPNKMLTFALELKRKEFDMEKNIEIILSNGIKVKLEELQIPKGN